MKEKILGHYIQEIDRIYQQGNYSEYSFRAPLEALLKECLPGLNVIQEPTGQAIGVPDFVVKLGAFPLGFCECKDIDGDLPVLLDDEKIKAQLERYRTAIDNLIFTNYRDFLLFQAGSREPVAEVHLGPPGDMSASRVDAKALCALFKRFKAYQPEPAATPEQLAKALASRARVLSYQIRESLERDRPSDMGQIVSYYNAFSEFLIRGISVEQFSDAYAQTIAYDLFMAAAIHGKRGFNRTLVSNLLPETFHLVKTLFEGISSTVPPELEWVVDSMAGTLEKANLPDILSAFRKRETEEDPFMHFYEDFLAAFNPQERKRRGVYFTSRPVVSFIVNSVNYLLKTRFGMENGLANEGVTVLDPAAGTGTFLEYAIRLAYEENRQSGMGGMFRELVKRHILKNFYGFELLVAPYTIAHIKLAMTLEELGYELGRDDRLRVYLTNTLDPQEIQPAIFPFTKDLSDESRAANEVKTKTPILVIMGNPPYSGASANKNPWIDGLLKGKLSNNNAKLDSYYEVDGKPLKEKNPKCLQDDYVKFIRFAQWKIDQAGQGILAFITNHAYLDNITFRGMRESLLNSFTEIYILNLHGSSRKKERCPDGSRDENVFDIQQGVAIGIFVKEQGKKGPAKVHYADLWGKRDFKYDFLAKNSVESFEWQELKPHSPCYFFVPMKKEEFTSEYKQFWSIKDIMPENSTGIITARDSFVIDLEKNRLIERIRSFKESKLSDDDLHEKFKIAKKKGWNIRKAWNMLQKIGDLSEFTRECLYRPFDVRWIFYHPAVIGNPRLEVMRHMLAGENLGLITTRQTKEEFNALVTDKIIGHKSVAIYDICSLFPLYLYNEGKPHPTGKIHMLAGENLGLITTRQISGERFEHAFCTDRIIESCAISNKTKEGNYLFPLYLNNEGEPLEKPKPNLNPEFLKLVAERTGRERSLEAVFYYIYGILYTPAYRQRYAEFLKYDFPRIPVFPAEAFEKISQLGSGLVELHLMKRKLKPRVSYPLAGEDIVRKIDYNESEKRVWINDKQYFEGVEPSAWEYHIGGYQVLKKWLDERRKWGKPLTAEMIEHFRQVHEILMATIDLQRKLDEAWPLKM